MIIGLDIGATHIRILSRQGSKIMGEKIHTPKSLAEFKKTLTAIIESYDDVSGIGIGVAGKMDDKKIISSRNMRFLDGFRLPEFLRKKFKVPVVMDNDAACFMRAEAEVGQAKNHKTAMGITIGTGLGGALARNKKIIRGANLKEGEISRFPFKDSDLETYASAKYLHSGGHFDDLGKNLAEGIADVIKSYKPDVLVLGGGVMANPRSAKLLTSFKKTLKAILKGLKGPEVRLSKFGEFGGALGASLQVKRPHR